MNSVVGKGYFSHQPRRADVPPETRKFSLWMCEEQQGGRVEEFFFWKSENRVKYRCPHQHRTVISTELDSACYCSSQRTSAPVLLILTLARDYPKRIDKTDT
ncbi:hypothetical protein Zmor_002011 [Zophobas morio]|uniref:Uncharacterized protein n=1 Tax=Zophobas morio TaxID=2755281 RepID=A0AA38J5A4_9CUCU|nr:hypothetical protein Zmor_002011 [Zophobas morio]